MKIQLAGDFSTRQIWINGKELKPYYSQKIRNHSPNGFNWSYGGSGPAQLALAILLEFMTKEEVLNRYQQFKWDFIATLPASNFDSEFEIPWLDKQIIKEESNNGKEKNNV